MYCHTCGKAGHDCAKRKEKPKKKDRGKQKKVWVPKKVSPAPSIQSDDEDDGEEVVEVEWTVPN